MRKVIRGIAVLSLALGPLVASADEYIGFYAGIGGGTARVEDDVFGFRDNGTAFKVFGGYSLAELLAVELAYMDGGTTEDSVAFLPGADLRTKQETRVVNLSVLGNLPLTERFALFGKVGLGVIDIDSELRVNRRSVFFPPVPGAVPPAGSLAIRDQIIDSRSDTSEELSYGAGAVYTFGEQVQLRAEYDGFDVRGGSLSFFSLSAVYRFR